MCTKVKNESSFLDALNQAAFGAEKAAHRLRASTALPFTQLDFEAEHPEWSLSAHRTSSASSSRPASAHGTCASLLTSSLSSASNNIPASRNERSASQATRSPSSSIQGISKARGNSSEPSAEEQDYLHQNERQQWRGGERVHFAECNGHAVMQAEERRAGLGNTSRYSGPAVGWFPAPKRKSHAKGFPHPSSFPEDMDSGVNLQAPPKQTSGTTASDGDSVQNALRGGGPISPSQDEKMWLEYRGVIDLVIHSLNSRYQELYPQLEGLAIRQEVC